MSAHQNNLQNCKDCFIFFLDQNHCFLVSNQPGSNDCVMFFVDQANQPNSNDWFTFYVDQYNQSNRNLCFTPSVVQTDKPDRNQCSTFSLDQTEMIFARSFPPFQSFSIDYPRNPNLHYLYPQPTVSILTNIANALAGCPKFYVQVLFCHFLFSSLI